MRVVFDIETNGVDFSEFFLPQVKEVFCIVTKDLDTGKISQYYDTDGLRELGTASLQQGINFLNSLGPNDELIGHNIIQFDLPVLRKLHNLRTNARIHDTLVASRTLYPDRVGGHSLGGWGERLGFDKSDFSDFTHFSLDMLEYCRRDVELTARVYDVLHQETSEGRWEKALHLEHRIAEIIAEQERVGFCFDVQKAERLLKDWEEEISGIDARCNSIVGNRVRPGATIAKPFKINGDPALRTRRIADDYSIHLPLISGPFCVFTYEPLNFESKAKQKELLLELGWEPENTTANGSPRLDDSIEKVGEVGRLLNRRNVISHRRSQVRGLLSSAEQDGRVHGGANPCGTNTSRMKHTKIVNIPRTSSTMGEEIRSLFVPSPGKILVGYDARALELRILAHYIGNEEYNDRVTTTDKQRDAHTLAARAGRTDDREVGKTINYALIYGAGDARLGNIIGGSERDGRDLRENLYRFVPGLGDLVRRAKLASSRGFLYALDGRDLYLRRRVSPLNTLIQGGGAIFMKTVAVHLDDLVQERNLDARKVVDMHDEAQWECDPKDVEALSSCITVAFDRAVHDLSLRCPQEPEIKIGQSWAETH